MRRLAGILGLLAFWTLASAQSAGLEDEAAHRAALETARKAVEARRFDQAVGLLRPVLADPAAEPGVRIDALFLRSRVSAARGKLAEAERDWREILALDPAFRPEPAMLSKKALARFEAVRAQLVGTVRITVEPSGAEVRLDGRGVSAGEDVAVLAGAHELAASRAGFDPAEQRVEVEADRRSEVRLELLPNAGSVVIQTAPGGVQVRLDGEPAGVTSEAGELALEGVPLGEHRIDLDKSCYRATTLQVSVQADLLERTVRRVGPIVLDPLRASLALRGGPPGTAVLVDGERVGELPLAPLSRCPGPAKVEVRAGSRLLWSETAELDPDADLVLDVRPRPNVVWYGPAEGNALLEQLGARPGGDLPAGMHPDMAESWRGVPLADDIDLVAAFVPASNGSVPRWLWFSPVLGTVEAADPALDPGRPRWRGGDLGLEMADSRIGGSARVIRLAVGGPAERAGIKIGDRIAEVAGHPIAGARELRAAIDAAPEEVALALRILSPTGGSRALSAVPVARARAIELDGPSGSRALAAAWARVDAVALPRDEAAAALANLARLLSRAGRHTESAAAWEGALASHSALLCPGTGDYHRGVELEAIGRAAEAADAFRRAAGSSCSGFDAPEARVAPVARARTPGASATAR